MKNQELNIFITIGLYQTMEAAKNDLKEKFKYVAIKLEEGLHQEVLIGDFMWWWSADSAKINLMNIIFIRNNAMLNLSCYDNYSGLKNLAKSIDNDIVNKEPYIEFETVEND